MVTAPATWKPITTFRRRMDSDSSDTSIVDRVRPTKPENPFSCNDCDVKFKRKDLLLRHRRTQHDDYQNGQQKHRCPFDHCIAEIGRRDHLRRHIVMVHKADPDEVLPTPNPIKRNSTKGTGSDDKEEEKKRFKCVFEGCSTELSRMEHLKRHVRLVHKQDPAQVPGLEGTKRKSGGVRKSGPSSKRKKKGPNGKEEESKATDDYLEFGHHQQEEDHEKLEEQDRTGTPEEGMEMEETSINIKEENLDEVMCILCCSVYYPSGKMGGTEILKELVYQVAENRGGGGGSSSSSKFKNAKVKHLPVCSQCRELAGSVTEKRLEVDLIEVEVRRLQVQILKEMRKLERRMADYGMEWRKLEGVVNQSDVECLEQWLRGNAREGKMDDNSLVLLLRDGILSGGSPLENFHKDLESKLCYSLDNPNDDPDANENAVLSSSKRKYTTRTQKSLRKVKVTPPPPEEASSSKYSKDPELGQVENADDYDSNPSPAEAAPEVSDDDEGPTNNDNLPQQIDDDDDDEEAEEDPDFNLSSNELSESEEEDDDDGAESGSASENEVDEEADMHSKRKRKSELKGKTGTSKPVTGNKQKRGNVGKKKKDAILQRGIDTSKWTAFKRKLLQKCDSESRKRQKLQTSSDQAAIPDPRLKYCLEYNPTCDQFQVGSIPVILPTSDNQESLECSKCAIILLQSSLPHKRKVGNEMQKHILRHHLSVFQCPLCPSNLGSFQRYQDHLRGHQGSISCSECNRSFVCQESLRAHTWNRHMTPEQISQALEAGEKDPRRKKNPDKPPPPQNTHQCPTCGKGFSNATVLKTHEAIHREDRERLLCPICGGIYTGKANLDYHQKYSCFPPGKEPPRIKCDQCPSTFKSKPLLKRHLKYVHSSAAVEKPFKCEVCAKGFPDKSFLTKHLVSHSDDRPYLCRNGCGATYKTAKHRLRHEKICGGVSTGRSVARGRKVEKIDVEEEDEEDGGDMHMNLYRGHSSGAFS